MKNNLPNYTIERGSRGDAAAVLTLLQTSFEAYRSWLVPESGVFRETVDGLAERIASGDLFVAMSDGQPVGCILCAKQPSALYFGRLAVHPSWRRRGVAAQLVGAAEDLARAYGFEQITCAARILLPDNVRFFQSLGYVISAEKTHAGFTEPTFYQLVKSL